MTIQKSYQATSRIHKNVLNPKESMKNTKAMSESKRHPNLKETPKKKKEALK